MIAREYGQPPQDVAQWEPEWLAAASTALAAESSARAELQKRAERKARMKRGV